MADDLHFWPLYTDVNPYEITWVCSNNVMLVKRMSSVTVQGKVWPRTQLTLVDGSTVVAYCTLENVIRGLLQMEKCPPKAMGGGEWLRC